MTELHECAWCEDVVAHVDAEGACPVCAKERVEEQKIIQEYLRPIPYVARLEEKDLKAESN